VDRVDAAQRRRRGLAVPLAVVYKFFDDQGNYLAAVVTYYAFVAIFPLMLIASSILGFVLQGDDALRERVLDSALGQFPVVGTQLGRPQGLRGSASAVVAGSLAALYGVVGLGQASQHAINTTWAVPRNSRLNPVVSRLRSLILLVLGGLVLLVVAVLSSLAPRLEVFGSQLNTGIQILVNVVSVALTAVVLAVMMNLATSHRRTLRAVLPGAAAVALQWQLLQLGGGIYVGRVVSRANEMNGVFAVVLGLMVLLYIAAVMAVLGMEINVVLDRKLYPRALLTPFTDAVELTDADRRVYSDYAKAQRHKGFERVRVSFDPPPKAEEHERASG